VPSWLPRSSTVYAWLFRRQPFCFLVVIVVVSLLGGCGFSVVCAVGADDVFQEIDIMAYRKKMKKRKSKKLFSKTASRTHKKNIRNRPMRGGIRL